MRLRTATTLPPSFPARPCPFALPLRAAVSFILLTVSHGAFWTTCFIPCHQPNSPIILIYCSFL